MTDKGLLFAKILQITLLKRLATYKDSAAYGLHAGQLPIIETVQQHDGCTQRELADMMRVSPASIAVSAKRLEKAGLITRRTDEANARCNRLSVTEEGSRACCQCREIFDRIDALAFDGFSAEELVDLEVMLNRIISNLGGETEALTPAHIAALAEQVPKDEMMMSIEEQEDNADHD